MSGDRESCERILVVDDEPSIQKSLRGILEDEGYAVLEAMTGQAALDALAAQQVDLVLLDIWLPDLDGVDVLGRIKAGRPDLPVVMMSGHGTIEVAVRATKLGAYDFIEKPLGMEKTILTIRHALDQKTLREENTGLRQALEDRHRLVGTSRVMQELLRQAEVAAPTNGRILISGENGTGKELLARLIHLKSRRFQGPFVEINCAAIPEELIESELFGHERGAFTGAVSRKQGKFELADGGTLFLDEVGDMSLKTQAKVLRVLEEQSFSRIGGTKPISCDVRVIAASNKNLEEEIHAGRFREDLFYRLNVIPFHLPPLRERRRDIPLLVKHFMALFAEQHGLPPKEVAADAMDLLSGSDWPGNVRQLRNLVERIIIMIPQPVVTAAEVASLLSGTPSRDEGREAELLSLREARAVFERNYIAEVVAKHGGNISRAAKSLGIERSNLHRKLRQMKTG
jgi:two-component system nitrogen regulation response regulator NtrX